MRNSVRHLYAIFVFAALGAAVASAAGTGQLALTVVDEKTGQPVACRMHLYGPNKAPRKIDTTPFWNDHFVFPGRISLRLPLGRYTFEIERGPEYLNQEGHFLLEQFSDDAKDVKLRRFVDMSAEGWWSGDLYVRRPARDVPLLMAAEDLHLAQVVTWWNEKNDWHGRNPPKEGLASCDNCRWYHLMAGGYTRSGTELLCFHLPAPRPLPHDGSDYPCLVQHLLKAREQKDLWVDLANSYGWDLPLLVAHGQVDSIEVIPSRLCRKKILGDETGGKPRDKDFYQGPFGYARWEQDLYFKLLDCGLRIPPTAGSGSGVTPNPVGYNRVYVHLDGKFDYGGWWKNLAAGRVVVTNGPLLRPKVEGELPGHVFQSEEGQSREFEIGLNVATSDPISYLDIIQDGKVKHSIRFEDYAASGRLPKIRFERSGWFLLRAVSDLSETYRFAMTGPYYVEIGPQRRISKKAAQFFLDWLYQRARQLSIDDPQQRREVLDYYRKARDYWQDLVSRANAE